MQNTFLKINANIKKQKMKHIVGIGLTMQLTCLPTFFMPPARLTHPSTTSHGWDLWQLKLWLQEAQLHVDADGSRTSENW